MYEVIGIAGTSASGKDSGAEYLAQRYGYLHISTADLIRTEAIRRYGSDDQYLLRKIGHEMRQQMGKGALASTAIAAYTRSADEYAGVIVSSYRIPQAADVIRQSGGLLVFVDAPVEERYKRLQGRNRTGESKSLEEFVQFELDESAGSTQNGLNLSAVRDMSDIQIMNDSSEPLFHAKLDSLMTDYAPPQVPTST